MERKKGKESNALHSLNDVIVKITEKYKYSPVLDDGILDAMEYANAWRRFAGESDDLLLWFRWETTITWMESEWDEKYEYLRDSIKQDASVFASSDIDEMRETATAIDNMADSICINL